MANRSELQVDSASASADSSSWWMTPYHGLHPIIVGGGEESDQNKEQKYAQADAESCALEG